MWLLMLKIQVQIAVTASLSLPTAGICCADFANTRQTLNDLSAMGVRQQVVLNRSEDRIGGSASQFLQSPRKDKRFNKYHRVRYTTLW